MGLRVTGELASRATGNIDLGGSELVLQNPASLGKKSTLPGRAGWGASIPYLLFKGAY